MNRVNPLYLALLLIVLILLLVFNLSGVRADLAEAKESIKQTTKVATELSGLKKVYTKKINPSVFNSKSIVKTNTKTGATISAKEMDVRELNSFMGKVINGAYNITTLNIKKISDTKASLYLEIKW
ncbi:MAG: hypothetical protein DRG78_22165 [Epsilonproteobacteria bacterium]|nr:MAG: hypothetical protein DRG78_22165 [Campylobacterota bacterium]